jgi:hypothetical protein
MTNICSEPAISESVSLDSSKSEDLLCDLRLLDRLSTVVRVHLAVAKRLSSLTNVTAQSC